MDLSIASLEKLFSFVAWTALYLCFSIKWTPEKSPEWCSRAVTLLHGSVAACVGVYQCRTLPDWECVNNVKTLPHHYALMFWSWGYFAFDLLWCLIYWSDHKIMLLHHLGSLGAINMYINKTTSGCIFPCALSFMEITNPLLQIRWFLRCHGYNQTILFLIVEFTYLCSFVVVRGIFGTYLLLKILSSDILDYEVKLYSLILYFVSVAFIYEILGYVLYKYKSKIVSTCGRLRLKKFINVPQPQEN